MGLGGVLGFDSKSSKSKSSATSAFERFPGVFNTLDFGRSPLLPSNTSPQTKSFSTQDLERFFDANPNDPQAAAFRNALTDSTEGRSSEGTQKALTTLSNIARNLQIGNKSGGTGDLFSPAQQLAKRIISQIDAGQPEANAAGNRALLALLNGSTVAPQTEGDQAFASTPDILNIPLLKADPVQKTSSTQEFNSFLDSVLNPETITTSQGFRNLIGKTVDAVGGRSAQRGLGQPNLATLVGTVAPLENAFNQQQVSNRGALVDKLLQEQGLNASFNIAQLNSQVDQLKNEQNRLVELSIKNADLLDARQKRDLQARVVALQVEQARLQEAARIALARKGQDLQALQNLASASQSRLIQTSQSGNTSGSSTGINAGIGVGDAGELSGFNSGGLP